jgi:nucleotide-binding universal stress UspA family protein
MKTVMVAIEDSAEAAGLTTLAAAIAGHHGEVHVVHVVELGSAEKAAEARHAVAPAVELLRARGVTCRGPVETTDCGVVRRMVERVRHANVDLLVMGSRGLPGLAALRGHSVSHAVLADLDVPVLVMPKHARLPVAGLRRVLVAVGSEWDTSAAVKAVELLPDAIDVLVAHVPRWVAFHVGRGPGNTFAEIGGETSRAVLIDAVERRLGGAGHGQYRARRVPSGTLSGAGGRPPEVRSNVAGGGVSAPVGAGTRSGVDFGINHPGSRRLARRARPPPDSAPGAPAAGSRCRPAAPPARSDRGDP